MPTSSGAPPPQETQTARAHFLELIASRRAKIRATWLAAGGTVVLAVILALWLIPGVPVGMSRDDYSLAVWVAFALVSACTLMAVVAVRTKERVTGRRELTNIWRKFIRGTVYLRNRHQFHRRLARECARARGDRRSSLSLILVNVARGGDGRAAASPDAVEYVASALAATVRASDVMGIVEDGEVGVLAIDAGTNVRGLIYTRLERTLVAGLSQWDEAGPDETEPVVSLGASTFDRYDDPSSLLSAARRTLRRIGSQDAQAA